MENCLLSQGAYDVINFINREYNVYECPFDFENTLSCIDYLINERKYTFIEDYNVDYVVFDKNETNFTSVMINLSKKNGPQVYTGDFNGKLLECLPLTYNIIDSPKQLTIGAQMKIVLSRTNFKGLRKDHLIKCSISFNESAILEFYRQCNREKSLRGFVRSKHFKPSIKLSYELNKLSLNTH